MSKGSTPRPYSVPKETFDQQFDWAFDVICKKCEHHKTINKNIVSGHCKLHTEKPNSCKESKGVV